jgi:AbrB family looped-hinge helix DNA binding protein
MTSTVTVRGQTVVPKEIRTRFDIGPGTTLDWQEDGKAIRVVKMGPTAPKGRLEWFIRLGRVPAAARRQEPMRIRK